MKRNLIFQINHCRKKMRDKEGWDNFKKIIKQSLSPRNKPAINTPTVTADQQNQLPQSNTTTIHCLLQLLHHQSFSHNHHQHSGDLPAHLLKTDPNLPSLSIKPILSSTHKSATITILLHRVQTKIKIIPSLSTVSHCPNHLHNPNWPPQPTSAIVFYMTPHPEAVPKIQGESRSVKKRESDGEREKVKFWIKIDLWVGEREEKHWTSIVDDKIPVLVVDWKRRQLGKGGSYSFLGGFP